ncbi:cobalamin biosynthesis protein [Acidovorax sp. CCYZU-2555]|uniref:cobalamin biosynthesis protein n=1 Tax=Acidovorax sp. CCYZU-2555 TaxID=2835042 RepID=UPI001BD00CAC|nr:cobalamin biosynthesis protein [Acidovorax sp. CCYZU-2555]MBS7778105.1 cobalamin biosynthesis protein [Acidovorax sp. CCYZU-2555]
MTPLFAGWGLRATASQSSFADCWAQACEQLAPGDWTFALLDSKRQTPAWAAFHAWAAAAVPQAALQAWPESAIAQIATPSVSPRLMDRFATGSVSEALALHAARCHAGTRAPQITLVLRRVVSADRQATLAVAAGPSQILETGVPS